MTQESQTPEVPARAGPRGITDIRDEIDRLWDAFLGRPWRAFPSLARSRPLPAMDVFEKEGSLHIRAELPGLSEKDVNVEVTGDAITISGEKKEEREVKEENYYRSERSFGSFRRQVALPQGADIDHIQARFSNGVLELEVPVIAAKSGSRKIEIKSGG